MNERTTGLFHTVPWYPGIEKHQRPEMPGGAVKLVLLIAEAAQALGMATGESIMLAAAAHAGCPLGVANKAFGVAVQLGLIERQPLTTRETGSA